MASFDRSRKPARRTIPGSVLFGPPPTVPSVMKKNKRRRSAENDSQTKAKAPRRQGAPLRIKMNLPKPDPTPEPEEEKEEDGTDKEAEETEVTDAPARTSPESKPTPSSAKTPTVVKEEDPELASERHQHAAIAQAVLASLSDNPSLPDDLPALVASLDAEQDMQSAQSQIALRLKKKMKQKAMVEARSEVWDEENITADSTAISKPKVLAESIGEYGVPKNDAHTERALRRMRIAFTEFDQQAGTPVLAHKALKPGKFVAMDCDTISTGDDGRHPMVARVTIVNFRGHILLDTYVQPKAEVTDYRTDDHGITAAHLENAPDFETVQQEVAALLKDRVLVGHELGRQLKLFQHNHPPQLRRDTSSYRDIVALVPGETHPTLKQLAATLFGITINKKQNSTAEAATMAMLLFRKFKKQWESFVGSKKTLSTKKSK